MPSGRTHTKMTSWLAVGLAFYDPHMALGAAAGVVLSPDLDVDRGYHGLHVVRTLLGEFAADAWRVFWYGYAALVPHRSWVSHAPLVGTLFRVAYMLLPVMLAAWLYGGGPAVARVGEWLGREDVQRAILGLVVADGLHVAADLFVTAFKEFWPDA